MKSGHKFLADIDENGNCPNCNCNWDGGDIYEHLKNHESYKSYSKKELRKTAGMYGWTPKTPPRFSHLIGLEYPEVYDGIWEWQCPECKTRFPRFKGQELVKQKQLEFSTIPGSNEI